MKQLTLMKMGRNHPAQGGMRAGRRHQDSGRPSGSWCAKEWQVTRVTFQTETGSYQTNFTTSMKFQPLGHAQVQRESKKELDETVEIHHGGQIQNNALSPLFCSGLNPLSQILMIVDPLQIVREGNLMEEQGQSNLYLLSPVPSPKTLMVTKLAKGEDKDQEAPHHAQGFPCPAPWGWTPGGRHPREAE